jgi:hypothetical protein
MIVRTFGIDGKPAIQLDKQPAIMVHERDATMQPTLQDYQLMSKHRVLGFKPLLRLEWRGQDGQNETKQPDHSASSGDSITSSTRIRFSVRTPCTLPCHGCFLPASAWHLNDAFGLDKQKHNLCYCSWHFVNV